MREPTDARRVPTWTETEIEAIRVRVRSEVGRTLRRLGEWVQPTDFDDFEQEATLALVRANWARPVQLSAGYMRAIARNRVIDLLRMATAAKRGKRMQEPLTEELQLAVEEPSPEESLAAAESAAARLRAIRSVLSVRSYKVFRARLLLGLSSRQTGLLLGMSPVAVDAALSRARAKVASSFPSRVRLAESNCDERRRSSLSRSSQAGVGR